MASITPLICFESAQYEIELLLRSLTSAGIEEAVMLLLL